MATQNRIDFTVGAKVDQNSFNQVKKAFDELNRQMATKNLDKNSLISKETIKSAEQFQDIILNAMDSTGKINFNKLSDGLKQSGKTLQDFQMDLRKVGNAGDAAFNQSATAIMKQTKQIKQSNKFLDDMFNSFKNIATYQINTRIFNSLVSGVQNAISFTKELDKNLTNIQIVTNKSSDSMRQFAKEANAAAKELSVSTNEYASASLIYYQQGLSDNEVKNRTNITAKVSNVTGQTAQQVSEELTAVWNGYKVAEDEAEAYVDKMAKVAASSASSLSELSGAMSKVASAASTSGVSMDQLTAQISTIESVTRQAPESIGTALKTIYARIGDLKVDGIDEFGTKLGEVSSTMKQMGVNVTDEAGNMREMGTIIEEVAHKWEGWTGAQKQAAAVAMAGKRQYNNLMALFDNWDQYESMKGIAEGSEGTLEQQQRIFEDSVEGRQKRLKASMEGIYEDLFSADALKGTNVVLTEIADTFDRFIKSLGGGGQALLSFGLILTKVFNKQITQGITNFMKGLEIKKNNQLQESLQLMSANAILKKGPGAIANPQDAAKAKEAELQAKYTKELIQLSSVLSNEEFETLKEMKNETAELEGQLALKKKIREETKLNTKDTGITNVEESTIRTNFNKVKQGGEEAESGEANLNRAITNTRNYISNSQQTLENIDLKTSSIDFTSSGGKNVTKDEMQMQNKINKTLQQRKNIQDAIAVKTKKLESNEKRIEELRNKGVKISKKEKKELKGREAFEKSITKEINKQKRKTIEINEELKEQVDKAKASFKARNKKVTATEEAIQEVNILNQEIAETTSKSQMAKRSLENAFNSAERAAKLSNTIKGVTNALTGFVMVGSTVSGVMDIINDDELSGWEKFGQIVEQLVMTIPMMAMSFGPLLKQLAASTAMAKGKALASKEVITSLMAESVAEQLIAKNINDENIAKAKNLIMTNKNITAKELAAAAGIEEAAAEEILATATDTATASTISFNTALLANPIVLIVAAIAALIGVMVALAKAEEEERKEKEEAIKQTNENITKTNEEIRSKRDLIQSLKDLNEQYKKTGEGADELKKKAEEVLKEFPEIKNGQLLLESGNYDEILRQGEQLKIQQEKEAIEKNKKAKKQVQNWSAADTGVEGVAIAHSGHKYEDKERAQKAADNTLGGAKVVRDNDGSSYKVKTNHKVVTYEDVAGVGYGSGAGTGDIKFFKEYDKKMQQLADQYGIKVEDFYQRVGGNKEGDSAYLSIDETKLKENNEMYLAYQKMTQEMVDKYNDTGDNEIEVATAMRKALEGQKDAINIASESTNGILEMTADIADSEEINIKEKAKTYDSFKFFREELKKKLKEADPNASDNQIEDAVGKYITTLNNNVLNAYEKVYAKSQTIEQQDFFKNIENDDAIKDKDKLTERIENLYGKLAEYGMEDFDLGQITREQWEKFYNIEDEKKATKYMMKIVEADIEEQRKEILKNTLDSKDFKETNKDIRELYDNGKFDVKNLKGLEKWDELVKLMGGDAEKTREKIKELYEEDPDAKVDQINSMGKNIQGLRDVLQAKSKNPDKAVDADVLSKIPDDFKQQKKEYEEFINIAGNSKSTMKEVQASANKLASAYYNSSTYLDTLTDKNEDWIASQLKAVGIANADAVAHDLKAKALIKENKNIKNLISAKELDIEKTKEARKELDLKTKSEKASYALQLLQSKAFDRKNVSKDTTTAYKNEIKALFGKGKALQLATQLEKTAAELEDARASILDNLSEKEWKQAQATFDTAKAIATKRQADTGDISIDTVANRSADTQSKFLNGAKDPYEMVSNTTDFKRKNRAYKKAENAMNKWLKGNQIKMNFELDPDDDDNGSKSGSKTKQPKKLEKITEEVKDYNDAYREVNEEIEKLQRNLDIAASKSEKLTGKQKQNALLSEINLLEKINKQEMKRANIADKQVKAAEKKLSKKTKGKKNEGHTYETWNFKGVDLSDADSVEKERTKLEKETRNIKTKYNNAIGDKKTAGTYAYDVAQFEKKWGNKELNKKDSKYKARKKALEKLESKKYSNGYSYSDLKEMKKEYNAKKKRQENFESIVKDSDEARAILEEAKENIRQNLYNEIDKKVESFKLRFEVRTDISAAHKSLKELQKSMHELNGEGLSTLSKDMVDIAQIAKEDFSGPDGAFTELKTLLNDNNMFKAEYYNEDYKNIGKISVEDMEQYKESVQEAYDKSIEKFEEIQDAYSQLQEYLIQSVNDWGDAVSKVLEIYSSVNEVLEWQLELTKLIKGENKYADNISNIDSQLENLRGNSKNKEGNYTGGAYGAVLAARDKAYELMTTLTDEEAKNAAKELWMDYDSQLRDNLSQQADLVKEKMSQALSQAFDTAFKKSNGGNKSLESLKSDWENASKYANKYKDTVEKNFEINKRISELKMQVDGMSDVYAAQKLNSEMQKEIKHLQEIGKLSQAELDRYDKIYQVKLAQIALENAQNNKNTMRLRRDSQGNYSYVFQADAAEIEKAKQDLENKKYELYETEKKSIENSINEYFETFEDLGTQVQRMLESNDYTTEEVETYIDKQMNQIQLAQDAIIHRIDEFVKDNGEDFAKAFEMTAEDWNKLTDEEKKQKLKEATEKAETNPDSNMNLAFLGPDLQKGLSKVFSGTSDIKTELLNYKSTVTSAYDEQQASLNSIEESMKQVTEDTKSVTQYLQKNKESAEAEVKKKANEIKETQKNYETVRNIYADLSNYIDGTEYVKNEDGSYKLDENGNLIVDKEKTEKNNKEGKSLKSLLPKIDKVLGDDAPTSSSTTGGSSGSKSSGSSSNSGSGSSSKTYTPSKIKNILSKADYAKKGTGKEKSGLNQMLYKKTGYVLKNENWRGSGGATAIQFFAWAIGADTKGGYSRNGAIAKKLKSAYGFRTGGYTGDWSGPDGKFALLHQKELVLNATDTKNILAAVQELRSLNLDYLTSNIKTKASNILSGMLSEFATAQSTLASSLHAAGADGQVLDQNVHIEASFPNVKDAKEVEAALNNLTSRASQYIHSSEKMR